MADCKEYVYSNDYFDLIVFYGDLESTPIQGGCTQRVNEDYEIFYYPREGLPPASIAEYGYSAIPKCYGLMDQSALEASGILRMQNQPNLALKGTGVIIGLIDTGIDYTNPLFRFADGTTRIRYLWDQTVEDGTPPVGILYGAQYDAAQINEALASENPYEIVPSRDENGHGTFLAGVACGGEDSANDFIGAAPQSQIVVVKLKEAKQYLRDFFYIPEDEPAYQENDIMVALSYLNGMATVFNQPMVILIGLGNSMGNHGTGGRLVGYLNSISGRRRRVVVTATGNEANARHHYEGRMRDEMEYEDVEISVERDLPGFTMELWAEAPELYAVSVTSPTGEQLPQIPVRTGASTEFTFLFEGTTVTIDYRLEAESGGSQLIFFRFSNPRQGIWVIRVYPQRTRTGTYHMWLPIQQFLSENVFFLRSNPNTTLTTPGVAAGVITVGGYEVQNQSIYMDSGRGFAVTGEVKPDIVAPAVNVMGPGLRGNYITSTGTSIAAAITAGACAQIMQWAIVDQNNLNMSAAGIKNMLIRGARITADRSYPNPEWGYGMLDVYQAFENLRI